MNIIRFLFLVPMLLCACKKNVTQENMSPTETPQKKERQLLKIHKSLSPITIDGMANEAIWQKSQWHPIDQVWLGDSLTNEDFSGRYKLSWSDEALFVLAEIKDDSLVDHISDPLVRWWDDDCLEIFVDQDNSGGEHQYNHNAFAYHIALDGNVVDMSTEKQGKLYNSHVTSKRLSEGHTTLWEVKMSLFDDTYSDTTSNEPVLLKANSKIGFAIAYCDNDTSDEREHFIGSIPVEGDDKNRGWIDANIFGTLLLEN
ncbi:sugar-binding protein [Psychroserpens sp. BH13MA-6]